MCQQLVTDVKSDVNARISMDPKDLYKAISQEYYLINTVDEVEGNNISNTIMFLV